METAANPGLDSPHPHPYQQAKDYCAVIDTVLRAVARLTLLTVAEMEPAPINAQTSWKFSSWRDEAGTLHRWITVADWGRDAMARELHGWATIGDMAMARAPMMIHVIEIGTERNGRRASVWARGWRNPGLPNTKMHFRQPSGKPFNGWTPVYYADERHDPDAWVEQMFNEGSAQEHLHHADVRELSELTVEDTRRQIRVELGRMEELLRSMRSDRGMLWRLVPMARGACDGFVPCPFQEACYGELVKDIGDLGLYRRKDPAWYTKQAVDNGRDNPVLV